MLNTIISLAEPTVIDPIAKVNEMIATVDFSIFIGIVAAVLTATLACSVGIIGLVKGYNFLLKSLKKLRG